MQAVQVSGTFANERGDTVDGWVKFIPSQIWVEDGEDTYPTLAPEVELVNGTFNVLVTRTDQADLPWHYTVETPAGKFTIHVNVDGPVHLKNLLPKRYA